MSARRVVLLVLLGLAMLPYFVGLGTSSLWDANEAFYAQTPREMLAASDPITPSFNFQLRFNKPVLPYWTVAAFYKVFGVSERSERLPIAIGAMVLVGVAFGLGRLVSSTEGGLLAALVLATTPRLLLFARRIIIDVHMAMFAALILLCFALAEARPPASAEGFGAPMQARRKYLVLMYIAAGLGTLTKGPIAVLLPALAFFVYLIVERRIRDLSRMMLPLGALIWAAIVLPWYALVYREHGWEHILSFVVGENLVRYSQPIGAEGRGFLFYLPVMMGDLFPWSVLLPFAMWFALRDQRVNPFGRIGRLLVIWVVTIVAFFSFSQTKEDLYILPIVPAEAALIGVWMAAGFAGSPTRQLRSGAEKRAWLGGLRWNMILAGCALLLAGTGVFWLFVQPGRYSLRGMGPMAALLVGSGIAVMAASASRRLFAATAVLCAGLIAGAWVIVLVTLPDFERYKPVRPFAAMIQERASPDAIVGHYRFALPTMVYYLQRPIMEVVDADHLRSTFRSSSDVYFLMPEAEYLAVKDSFPVPTYVLARRPLFDIKPINFLEGDALPEMLLISNRPE